MKKIISFLRVISLTTVVATSLVACNSSPTKIKPNNEIELKPTSPPKGSKWEICSDKIVRPNTGWYFYTTLSNFGIKGKRWDYDLIDSGYVLESWIKYYNKDENFESKALYHWTGKGKPNRPTFDRKTGQITNWNEKIETENK